MLFNTASLHTVLQMDITIKPSYKIWNAREVSLSLLPFAPRRRAVCALLQGGSCRSALTRHPEGLFCCTPCSNELTSDPLSSFIVVCKPSFFYRYANWGSAHLNVSDAITNTHQHWQSQTKLSFQAGYSSVNPNKPTWKRHNS